MSQIDTDVIWSVRNGELEEVKNFVAKGADVNKIVVAGRKPIHFAADSGQLDVLEFLIHAGADINTPDANGFTALMSAVCEGHLDCVRLLLSKGADKTVKFPEGHSCSEVAATPEMKELFN
ncbi:myotrophin isoform X2 [Mobula hypostoma]|uniref:myotrophin isoform X2 n=1 Tax=Mobula hypostoma TaxID=723540 RepID=UPI002FC37AE8